MVAPKGPSYIDVLGDLLDGEMGASLPNAATPMFRTMLELLEVLNSKIAELDKEIARRAREDVIARRRGGATHSVDRDDYGNRHCHQRTDA